MRVNAGRRRAGIVMLVSSLLASGAVLATGGPATADTTPPGSLSEVGTVPPLASGATPQGPLAGEATLQLSVVLRSADPKGLAQLADAVSTPGTAQFHHFLTPAEVQARFGPPPGQVASVTRWLTRHGLRVGTSSGDGLVLPVTGSASAVGAALDTRFAQYR
ncbi:MAG TPA: protease pro-enzyme activation domain-containing protein, partial [Acidimicrobiales bacterium]|nr:protease pro-enzyme activation domain-containing protein [Acidimicrobiales bacterium]